MFFICVFSCYVYAGPGEDVSDEISAKYNSIVDDCGGDLNPAYECSGVVLHGEGEASASWPWSPSSDNSMSYSYLRKDIFNPIFDGYDYGIILTPQNNIENRFHPIYKCAFPINGASNSRTDDGCGMQNGGVPESAPCQSQGLFNSADFIAAHKLNPEVVQCGWGLTNTNSSTAFKAMLESSNYIINYNGFAVNNEIVIESWGSESVANLPVQAIFYSKRGGNKEKTARSLLKAQEAQLGFFEITNIWIPIINMTEFFPEPGKTQYSFSYVDDEQFVPEPTPSLTTTKINTVPTGQKSDNKK
jgi:hypothetical protein